MKNRVKKNKRPSRLVGRLSTAALALPGILQQAHSGRVEETYNADFQYGHYGESNDRVDVDIFEGVLSAPIGRSLTASLNLVRDTITGASPRYNRRDEQGKIQQVLSGATLREQRDAISPTITYFFDQAALSLGGSFSREHDYTSRLVNTQLSVDLNKKLTTLNIGGSVAFDEIEPTGETFKRSKTTQQYFLGFSQIIDKDTVIRSNITFGYRNGFLSDPYKRVLFENSGIRPDTRPENKFQWAWLAQYVHYFKQFNSAALHADYRFYSDEWGVEAHTFEFSWHQPVADGWQIIPQFRYYSQNRADFYEPVFTGNSNATVFSSDYRLADFGAFSGGLKISKELTRIAGLSQIKFQAGFEYYDRQSAYQLGGDKSGSFDDFNYYLVTASFNLKF